MEQSTFSRAFHAACLGVVVWSIGTGEAVTIWALLLGVFFFWLAFSGLNYLQRRLSPCP